MIQFICNGSLLSIDIVHKLQKNNILFSISIDGDEFSHNANRVDLNEKGTIDLVLDKIKNKEYLGASVTLSNNNVNLVNTVKFLLSYFNTISMKIVRASDFLLNADKKINGYEN